MAWSDSRARPATRIQLLATAALGLVLVIDAAGGSQPAGSPQARPAVSRVQASQQFQEAITLMESRGDYAAAIELFRLVAQASDRRLAGQAQLYVGLCYERLGTREAAAAYQQVIEKFPDQPTLVQEARRRLAALAGTAATGNAGLATLRQPWKTMPEHGTFAGSVSADGRVVAFRADDDPLLMLVQASTGAIVQRRSPRRAGEAGNIDLAGIVPSPSAGEVAFSFEVPGGGSELRILRSGTGEVRVAARAEVGEGISPIEWRRAERLLVSVRPPRGGARLAVLTIAGNTLRPVIDLPDAPAGASLSPDGRSVVFGALAAPDANHTDIFIVPASGGAPALLVGGPADDWAPTWTDDGQGVIFVSDRGGSTAIWMQAIARGQPSGKPRILHQDIGRFRMSLGLTAGGAYYYLRQTGLVDVYTVDLDDRGRVTSAPVEVASRFIGTNMGSSWGPDGSLVFLTHMGFREGLLQIRDARGVARVVDTHMQTLRVPIWSPDGRAILVRGHDRNGRYGIHLVDPQTGITTPLITVASQAETTLAWASNWGRDAGTLLLRRQRDGISELRVRTIATGEERLLLTAEPGTRIGDVAVSRTDESIAYVLKNDAGCVLEARGPDGRARVLLRTAASESIDSPSWMPDGRHLTFVRRPIGGDGASAGLPSLWTIDGAGGNPEALGVSMDGLRNASVSPDGHRLAFTAGWPISEVWVLENFLRP